MNMNYHLDIHAVVIKLSVSNLQNAVTWYQEHLGLIPDPHFTTPTWSQLHIPGVKQFAIGLEESSNPATSGGESTSFAVHDIEKAREQLIKQGVAVQPVIGPVHGAKLAFFNDLDGNILSLRQSIKA